MWTRSKRLEPAALRSPAEPLKPLAAFSMPPPPLRPPHASTSTLADAFSHISSSLTSSLITAGSKPRIERTDSYEHLGAYKSDVHGEGAWKGMKLLLNPEDDGHLWSKLGSNVIIRKRPFAHGGQRNAFHLFDSDTMLDSAALFGGRSSRFLAPGAKHFVAKENRFREDWNERRQP